MPQKNIKVRLREIRNLPGNDRCADCDVGRPTWASFGKGDRDFVCLVCDQCSGAHRHMGTHITFVQSTTIDERFWMKDNCEKLKQLKSHGNTKCNQAFAHRIPERSKITENTDGYSRQRFVHDKYEHKAWYKAPKAKSKNSRKSAKSTAKSHQRPRRRRKHADSSDSSESSDYSADSGSASDAGDSDSDEYSDSASSDSPTDSESESDNHRRRRRAKSKSKKSRRNLKASQKKREVDSRRGRRKLAPVSGSARAASSSRRGSRAPQKSPRKEGRKTRSRRAPVAAAEDTTSGWDTPSSPSFQQKKNPRHQRRSENSARAHTSRKKHHPKNRSGGGGGGGTVSFDTARDDFDDVNWGDFEDATSGGGGGGGKAKSNGGDVATFAVDFDDDTVDDDEFGAMVGAYSQPPAAAADPAGGGLSAGFSQLSISRQTRITSSNARGGNGGDMQQTASYVSTTVQTSSSSTVTPSAASDEWGAFEDGSFDKVPGGGGFAQTAASRGQHPQRSLNSPSMPSDTNSNLIMTPDMPSGGGHAAALSSHDSLGDLSALMGGGGRNEGQTAVATSQPGAAGGFVDSSDDLLVPAATVATSSPTGLDNFFGDLTSSSSQQARKGRSMAESVALAQGHVNSSAATSAHHMQHSAQQAAPAMQGKPSKSSIMSLFGQSSQSMHAGGGGYGHPGLGGPPLGSPGLGMAQPGLGGYGQGRRPAPMMGGTPPLGQPGYGGMGGMGGVGGPPLGGPMSMPRNGNQFMFNHSFPSSQNVPQRQRQHQAPVSLGGRPAAHTRSMSLAADRYAKPTQPYHRSSGYDAPASSYGAAFQARQPPASYAGPGHRSSLSRHIPAGVGAPAASAGDPFAGLL